MYRLYFPLVLNAANEPIEYQVAVLPETCGFVNNQWWHPHLERRFGTPLDALVFAEDIMSARIQRDECPCEEECKKKEESSGRKVHIRRADHDGIIRTDRGTNT